MKDFDQYRLIVVLGPTASGKTKYAVGLADRIGGEIISADSRQVYRGMTIGTGKDLRDYEVDGRGIPYHLIDIEEPGAKYDIFRFQRDFATAYKDIVSRGKKALLCGGSGLYIEAVTKGYALPAVPPDPQLRSSLESKSDEELAAMLSSLTKTHNTTDFDSRKRLVRALEIAIYRSRHPNDDGIWDAPEDFGSLPKFSQEDVKYIGIRVSREERNEKIDRRLKDRLQEGLVEEVRGLMERGIAAEDLIYYGLEYKFVTKYILGEYTYDEMERHLAIAIHQFAKRQMTWFRGMERRGIEIEWVDPA